MYEAFVRAKTSDDRWATVNVVDLDDRSFKRFIVSKLVAVGVLNGMQDASEEPLTTELTKEQVESADSGRDR